MVTLILTVVMMAGLFLLLWGAVGFVQDKRLFSTAPKVLRETVQPKPERFAGQHAVGWCMLAAALLMMGGAIVAGAWLGIRSDFSYRRFFARFLIMLWGMKAFDILVFDWYLLCRSGFFPHYFPEVRELIGPHLFGYNRMSHLREIIAHIAVSAVLAWVCTLLR